MHVSEVTGNARFMHDHHAVATITRRHSGFVRFAGGLDNLTINAYIVTLPIS